MSSIFILLIFTSLITFRLKADELVIIQTVATDRHTFVIRRGHKQGIGIGQESLFTTSKVSLAARAEPVTSSEFCERVNSKDFELEKKCPI